MRLLAIAIVMEAIRLVAPGERAHAESPLFPDLPGVNSNALSIQVILCRRRIVFGRPWRALGLTAVTCSIRPSMRAFRIMSGRVNGAEKAELNERDAGNDGKTAKVAESKARKLNESNAEYAGTGDPADRR
jgi:hypothetical protein